MEFLIDNNLKSNDFCTLRKTAGWHVPTEEQTEIALQNSLYAVRAKDREKTIGMGRLVGDGVTICYIQDLIVLPEYQGQGVGKLIAEALLSCVQSIALPGTKMTVGLMSAKGKEGFYTKLGFRSRPNDNEGPGMVMNLNIEEETI